MDECMPAEYAEFVLKDENDSEVNGDNEDDDIDHDEDDGDIEDHDLLV